MTNEAHRPQETPQPNRQEIQERERLLLPPAYQDMTFRDRYAAQDEIILAAIDIDHLPPGTSLKILDMAGGILPFGSPTAHDLFDAVSAKNMTPEITVVDRAYDPATVQASYPEIQYSKELSDATTQEFHMIRMMHLIEHIPLDEYEKIRATLVGRLAEGGIIVLTQNMGCIIFKVDDPPKIWKFQDVIKVMQKRNGELVPIAVLPDTKMPIHSELSRLSNEERERRYGQYREKVQSGQEVFIPELENRDYPLVMRFLQRSNPLVLEHEAFAQIEKWFKRVFDMDSNELEISHPATQTVQNMETAKGTAAEWFKKAVTS